MFIDNELRPTGSMKARRSWRIVRKILFSNIFLLFVSLCVAFGIGEILLRVLPIRGIVTTRSVFDPELGYNRYAGQTNRYVTYTGKVVIKKTNRLGYFDKEHDEKKRGYRIAFFGDSYVESLQVPLESTFFRLIENELKDLNIECFAFGRSGYGPISSYMESRRWVNYYDLDFVGYVFCENDLGDQIKEIKKREDLWHVKLADDGYKIYKPTYPQFNYSTLYRIVDNLRSRSVLLTNISARIGLLFERGISLRPDENERMMATMAVSGKYPNANDLPSSWPKQVKKEAMRLGELVIDDFRRYVVSSNKEFAILYIPRESEFKKRRMNKIHGKNGFLISVKINTYI